VLLLLLMLDDARWLDRIAQAWSDLGIRGIHMLESVGCRAPGPAETQRAPAGMLSFTRLFTAGRYCQALLLAPIASAELAERAAEEVTRVIGPWSERPAAMMFALPASAWWGAVLGEGRGAGGRKQAEAGPGGA
jgi:hypothetical protein